jgi:NarL family two-component system response regulator LiaR
MKDTKNNTNPKPNLTPRELQVLECLKEGLTNEEIGKKIYVSVNTVKKHLESIRTKLSAKNRTQAIYRAAKCYLIN